MKLFLVDSWIDDRPILSQQQVKAGTLYTAAAKGAKITQQRKFRTGSRKRKLTIRVTLVDSISQ